MKKATKSGNFSNILRIFLPASIPMGNAISAGIIPTHRTDLIDHLVY